MLCARCTRFSNQVAGDPFIELFERGALEQVAIYEDEPFESYFSGITLPRRQSVRWAQPEAQCSHTDGVDIRSNGRARKR